MWIVGEVPVWLQERSADGFVSGTPKWRLVGIEVRSYQQSAREGLQTHLSELMMEEVN
jgi:hypothetical protein